MKTVDRKIVGAFIFSKDGHILLGKNRAGGVYEGSWTIPGGGVEHGESNLEALAREIHEEVGLDISNAAIEHLPPKSGESSALSKDTCEPIRIKMDFNDYKVTLPEIAADVNLVSGDDFSDARWFELTDLHDLTIAPPAKLTITQLITS